MTLRLYPHGSREYASFDYSYLKGLDPVFQGHGGLLRMRGSYHVDTVPVLAEIRPLYYIIFKL